MTENAVYVCSIFVDNFKIKSKIQTVSHTLYVSTYSPWSGCVCISSKPIHRQKHCWVCLTTHESLIRVWIVCEHQAGILRGTDYYDRLFLTKISALIVTTEHLPPFSTGQLSNYSKIYRRASHLCSYLNLVPRRNMFWILDDLSGRWRRKNVCCSTPHFQIFLLAGGSPG